MVQVRKMELKSILCEKRKFYRTLSGYQCCDTAEQKKSECNHQLHSHKSG